MSDEEAKAVQEIAKATGKGIDAIEKLSKFIKEIIGPGLVELGGAFRDWAVAFRYQNMLKLQEKVERIHQERRNAGKTIPILPRYAIPMLEHASMEDDESLQDMWAGLIANASDPARRLDIRKVYLDILASLEPLDAAVLVHLHGSQPSTLILLVKNLGISDEELRISLQNLARLGCIRQEKDRAWDERSSMGFDISDVSAMIMLNDLGSLLVEACSHNGMKVDESTGQSC